MMKYHFIALLCIFHWFLKLLLVFFSVWVFFTIHRIAVVGRGHFEFLFTTSTRFVCLLFLMNANQLDVFTKDSYKIEP